MSKILIVCKAFFPVNSPRSFRATELAKEFSRQGDEVTVLTDYSPLQASLQNEYGIRFEYFPRKKMVAFKGKFGQYINRILKLIIEFPDIQYAFFVKNRLKKIGTFDVLISIAVPHPIHWGVSWFNVKKQGIVKCWIADCGDPYYGQENDSFKKLFYFAWIENWFCKGADFITVPTDGAINGYFSRFHHKIRVIPQGFRFQDYQLNLRENAKPETVIKFAYAGLFIPGKRDPRLFLEFLCATKTPYEFHIYTNNDSLVKKYADLSHGRIIVHAFIPREQLLKELMVMDFLVNFDNIGSKQTPSKLIDYIILNKPILSIKNGPLDEEVIVKFLERNYEDQLVISDRQQYRIENVVSRFKKLF